MQKIHVQYYKNTFNEFIIGSYDEQLCLLDYRYRKMRHAVDKRIQQGLGAAFDEQSDPIIQQTIEQLEEYCSGVRRIFDLPLLTVGSNFQKRVWSALMDVPYGETASYIELSEKLGDKKAVRAVASANGANAIAIIIPCHRIIAANGDLTGYAGGLPLKKRLLELEQVGSCQLSMF